ncbi:small multi-drug export protein [archaeon]|nr:small multi-drug export protein [archaeon]
MNAFLEMLALTLVPWIELRGSIPYGITQGFDPLLVFVSCVATNILIMIPTFAFLDHIFPLIKHWKIVDILVKRTQKKSEKYVEKWGFLGLAIMVAIPLPFTGAYTGALAAKLFGYKKRQALSAISVGVIVAGILVLTISLFFKELIQYLRIF